MDDQSNFMPVFLSKTGGDICAEQIASDKKIAFIEKKLPNYKNVQDLLGECARSGFWANRGPLYRRLAMRYAEHMNISSEYHLTPCANGGIGLEALARVLSARAGRKLRWIAPSFCFKNLGRGYFSDIVFIDCDAVGVLNFDELMKVSSDSYDGIILVNAFGISGNFDEYFKFAKEHSKELIVDNASGIHSTIPDWPWQSFSLHHTKPYGFGEGGLALTPAWAAEELYSLIDYGDRLTEPESWLANGKLSDVACAFHLDRLDQSDRWIPLYYAQSQRIIRLAKECGLQPIREEGEFPPTASHPFLFEGCFRGDELNAGKHMSFGRYYEPMKMTPNAERIWSSIINIPTHPGLSALTDSQIVFDIKRVLSASALMENQL